MKADDDFEAQKGRSLALWKYLIDHLRCDRSFFLGQYSWFYYSDHSMSFDSFMLARLREAEWIPTACGSLKGPKGLPETELPQEFQGESDLAGMLGIAPVGETEEAKRREHAEVLGVSLEDVEFVRSHPEEFREWALSVHRRSERPMFPDGQSSNPERSRKRFLEELSEAPEKEYEHHESRCGRPAGWWSRVLG